MTVCESSKLYFHLNTFYLPETVLYNKCHLLWASPVHQDFNFLADIQMMGVVLVSYPGQPAE